MTVPEASIADIEELKRLHGEMGMTYAFPNLGDELTVIKRVVKDENNKIIAGASVKIIGEGYIWIDPGVSVRGRLSAIKLLDMRLNQEAKAKGFSQVSIWVPPNVPGGFDHLLEQIGWMKSPWPSWTRNIR